MTKEEELFHSIADELSDVKESKMFDALCIKTPNGKAGVMFWKDEMVFKLEEEMLSDTLNLKGCKMFDPIGGRPMNGWVVVPYQHHAKWKELAIVSTESVRRKKK